MTYLIDGYNLLFALGFQHGRAGASMLERARADLLARLGRGHTGRAGTVLVVFDAGGRGGRASPEQVVSGVRVRFVRQGTADDEIEAVIRREPAPQRLAVVSNDRRIRQAARRRECLSWTCDEYLDWLETPAVPRPATPPVPEKKARVTPEETDEWMREFGFDRDPG